MISHYKRDDIIKNKISNPSRYAGKKKERLLPALKQEDPMDEYADDFIEDIKGDKKEKSSFFATEPAKNKLSSRKAKKAK